MTFWSQSECLHEWFTTIIIINNNREEGIKHCTWKGQRNWIHRIQDSSVIYYNVKAINGKDGMECFFCVLILYQWPVKLIIDWSLQSTTTESGIYSMLWPNRPLGLFADFTVWTFQLPYYPIYCFHQFIIGQLIKL